MDKIDLLNAARLIQDHCRSRKSCFGCAFFNGKACFIDDVAPCYWEIPEANINIREGMILQSFGESENEK